MTTEKRIEQFSTYLDGKRRPPKLLPSGFPDLDDRIVYGAVPQDFLIYIQAKSSVGKTYFITNWITRLLKSPKQSKILFYSREMSYVHIVDRILQSLMNQSIVMVSSMAKDAPANLTQYLEKYKFFDRLMVIDGPVDPGKMDEQMSSFQPDIVFIDHLHKLSVKEGISEDIFTKTTYLSNELCTLKKKHKTRIVCLVQIKRLGKDMRDIDTGAEFSMMSDGKGSGAIEEDADMILSLRRPDISPDCQAVNRQTIHVAAIKNRYPSKVNGVMIYKYDPMTSVLIEVD